MVRNAARNDPHPALRESFSQREKDSLAGLLANLDASAPLRFADLERQCRPTVRGGWGRSRARCQLIFVRDDKSLLRGNSTKYELLDASILRLQRRDLGHVKVSFRIRRHVMQGAELSRRRTRASKSIEKL